MTTPEPDAAGATDEPTDPDVEPPTRAARRGPAADERYRTRAQEAEARAAEAEARAAGLADRLADRDSAEALRVAGRYLQDPADLWLGGVQHADLLDDNGDLDADKVIAAAQQVATHKPHWAIQRSPAAPTSQVGDGASPPEQPRNAAGQFRDAFVAPELRP